MQVLTHSRLASYRACPRKHRLSYTLGYRPIRPAPALMFGTVAHRCLETYWRARMAKLLHDQWVVAALDALDRSTELDDFDREKLRAMVVAYVALWDDVACEVLAVEATFRYPLLDPSTLDPSLYWELGGKIDAIIRRPNGDIEVVEHKTTADEAEPGGVYRQRLRMDGQVSTYWMGAATLGFDATRVIYDVLRKPKARPLTATPVASRKYTKNGALYKVQRERDETPEEYGERCVEEIASSPDAYLARIEVVRLDQELVDYAFDVWHYAEEVARSERTGVAPRNPDGCWKYNSACAYWEVCSGSASLDDTARFRVAAEANEELAYPPDRTTDDKTAEADKQLSI